jgi:hypothetical protein
MVDDTKNSLESYSFSSFLKKFKLYLIIHLIQKKLKVLYILL